MENTKLLTGSEIIHQKLNGPKELPASGWKEYCPSNTWLEQKQIQAWLEDKRLTIGCERIEKQNNLAQAEWISEFKKAKVLKKVGKHWEMVGHYQDNEDWLFPEEALYLIEINVLELFHGGVPVSVEHAYSLLLSESHNCTLQEYRVYSYLSRRGYKIIRHAEDITFTKYEKQINLDQVLEMKKRSVPDRYNDLNSVRVQETPSLNEISESSLRDSLSHVELPENVKEPLEVTSSKQLSSIRPVSDSEDICIIEDTIEIIEIEDNFKKSVKSVENQSLYLSTQTIPSKSSKQVNTKKPELIIIIDDIEKEDEDMEIKQEMGSESTEDLSEDDVVLVKTVRLRSRDWYKPLRKCLLPTEAMIVDLSDDVDLKVACREIVLSNEPIRIAANKTRIDILDEMKGAKSGVSFIKSPNAHFIPRKIIPKHSQYRVNLNMRQEPNYQQTGSFHFSGRRQQFYNPNFSNNQTNNSLLGDNIFMQAYEVRAMAMSMIQAATSLMSAMNNQPSLPSPGLISDMRIPQFYNPPQFSNPRLFNNNLFNNGLFGTPRNSFMPRNNNFSYGRRNNRFRGYRNNSNRMFSPHQKQISRYYSKPNLINTQEIVSIDSDDDSFGEQRPKRRGDQIEFPSKRCRPIKSIEIIDLCDDVPFKSEPIENSKTKPFSIPQQNNSIPQDSDRKTTAEIECKQETTDIVAEEKLNFEGSVLEPKSESENLPNVNEINLKTEKSNETENEINLELKENNRSKTESFKKNKDIPVKTANESSLGVTDARESPRTIEDSNDSEMDIMECNAFQAGDELSKGELHDSEEPTTWQQYKEQTGVPIEEEIRDETNTPLIQLEQLRDIALLLDNLQIFETIDVTPDERRKLKISFDAYLPMTHFKKTLKTLPNFRIIVVNSTDSLPSNSEIDVLKSSYQDGIPFIYAIVYEDTISFYYYDIVSLPKFHHD